MYVLITGSRSWDNIELIAEVMQKFPKDTVIIHGDAIGADTIAGVVAKELGFEVIPCPPTEEEIKMFGPSGAPLARNRRMVYMNPNLCIAFKDVRSQTNGTDYTIEFAKSFGIRTLTVSNT